MSEPETAVLEVALRNCFCATELESLERTLAALTGVVGVHVDRTRSVAHLRHAPSRTTAAALRSQVDALGYPCECTERTDSCCQPGHPCVDAQDARTTQHRPAGHPSGQAESQGQATLETTETQPAPGHAAHEMPARHEGHRAPEGHAHAGHGSSMVTDMLRRFVASAVLTVPIVLFSR